MESRDVFKLLTFGLKDSGNKFKNKLPERLVETISDPILPNYSNNKGKKKKKVSTDIAQSVEDDSIQYLTDWHAAPSLSNVVTATKCTETHQEQISIFRKQNMIKVYGSDLPEPIKEFRDVEKLGVGANLLENVSSAGYSKPTAIQMQAIPVMLQRREILACAPTGSGKTAAFILPILHHLKKPRRKGFRTVVLAPTRELAKQIYREFCLLSAGLGFRIHVLNNINIAIQKYQSSKKYDILVTTPNKLILLLHHTPPVLDLTTVEWLVIDESDKLFEPGKRGFREQLATIYKACSMGNPHIRRALFSATYTSEVETWCRDNLDNLITVTVGNRNTAVDVVKQELKYVGTEQGKLYTLRELIKQGFSKPALIFVQTKERAKELESELLYDGMNVDAIHADKTQLERDESVERFRSGLTWMLISTELMGRGIDFKGVNLVVNYDFPASTISYIHRIGRTGRAGRPGHAITFFTDCDVVNLRSIANVMRQSGCHIPDYMLSIKKPSKNQRRLLQHKPPVRERISTKTKPVADTQTSTPRKSKQVEGKRYGKKSSLSVKKKQKFEKFRERLKEKKKIKIIN